MARPREFDRDLALDQATAVFWAKGFAATSTEDLLAAMGIGRQSLYNAFGDKRQLYLEVLRTYQDRSTSAHLARLTKPASALDGIRDLLVGFVPDDDELRRLGCLGVGSIGEFGTSDPELVRMREKDLLNEKLVTRIREGQKKGELDPELTPATAAAFVQAALMGLQVLARAGADAKHLRDVARLSVDRMRAK